MVRFPTLATKLTVQKFSSLPSSVQYFLSFSISVLFNFLRIYSNHSDFMRVIILTTIISRFHRASISNEILFESISQGFHTYIRLSDSQKQFLKHGSNRKFNKCKASPSSYNSLCFIGLKSTICYVNYTRIFPNVDSIRKILDYSIIL